MPGRLALRSQRSTDDNTLPTSARLVELFRWKVDPSCDPIRTRIRQFLLDYVESKGSSGGTLDEGLAAFNQAVARDPQSWPAPADRLLAAVPAIAASACAEACAPMKTAWPGHD